jgi:phosphate transport system substrate-binding protein
VKTFKNHFMSHTHLNAKNLLAAAALLVVAAFMPACNGSSGSKSGGGKTGPEQETLLGAGSTFVYPLFSNLFHVYHDETGVKVNYQSIGSGGGILQLMNKTVDFGDSDVPLTEEQAGRMGAAVLHVPMCSGAVVVSYNIPGIADTLKLTPGVIAGIFLGEITRWDDKRITAVNPGVKLPHLTISVVHRSDGSGTTHILTGYLSKVSAAWKDKVGSGTAVNWPAGLGGKGNEGVSGLIRQTPGSIGYVELAYAMTNKMLFASVQNKSGYFITASVASTTAAGNVKMPADGKVSLTDTEAPGGYPISGFTWALIYREQNYNNRTGQRAKALVDLLWWNIHEGQKYCTSLDYAPLSPAAVSVAENILKSATYDGKPLLP